MDIIKSYALIEASMSARISNHTHCVRRIQECEDTYQIIRTYGCGARKLRLDATVFQGVQRQLHYDATVSKAFVHYDATAFQEAEAPFINYDGLESSLYIQ